MAARKSQTIVEGGNTITAKEALAKYYEAKGLKADGGDEAGGRDRRKTKTSDVYAVSFKQSKEGWIWKRKEQIDMYDKRWFVLKKEEKDAFYYYKLPSSAKPQGFIDLKSVTSISLDTTKKPNSFTLMTPKRHYHLYTDSEKERTEWMQFITENWLKSIRQQQRETINRKGSALAPANVANRSATANPTSRAPPKSTMEILNSAGREGYMWKIGGAAKDGKWQKRYFKLRQTNLAYGESPKTAEKGSIDLSKVTKVELDVHKRPFSWSLVLAGRTYYVACDDGADRDAWIESITQVLNVFKHNQGQSVVPDTQRIAAATQQAPAATSTNLAPPQAAGAPPAGASASQAPASPRDDEEETVPLGEEQLDDLLEQEGLLDADALVEDDSEESDYDLSVHENFFDEYELGRVLGEGGFAQVLEGRGLRDGKQYAVKWIKKEMVDDILYLKREITLMKMLKHKNIVQLYEVFEEDMEFFLVMELIKGKELFEIVSERGQYTEAEANNIIKQLVTIVAYLHEMGVAHRDIKPENILTIESEGNPDIIKLIDFGLAKKFKSARHPNRSRLATKVGTPCYLAPEVLTTKEEYSQAVDMWSVGVISYILLCGYHPFIGADLQTDKTILMRKIRNADFNFDHPNWDGVSSGAKNFIRHMICKDTKERYSAESALQDPWITGQGVSNKKLNTGLMRATSSFLKTGNVDDVGIFTPGK